VFSLAYYGTFLMFLFECLAEFLFKKKIVEWK
jgi:hypothetical protein